MRKANELSVASRLGLPSRYGISSDIVDRQREIPPDLFSPEAVRALRITRYFCRETCRDQESHSRHLIAALLTENETPEGPPLETPAYLREIGFDVEDLRAKLLQQILLNVPEDNPVAWEDILGDQGRPTSRPVPGYVSDSVGGRDQLGISEEVNALCAVAMAREFKPPLSIGLFGDWGSGKSFFMGMMRERIELLAECARSSEEEGEPTSYCSHVAQITFNAWHYIDADLWASLVTKIWEDLAQFIAKAHPEDSDAKTRALREQLKQGGDRIAEAERIAQETEEKRKDLETRISALEEEKGKRSEELAHLGPKAITSLVLDRPEVREPLAAAANKIGLPAAQAATRDTLDTLVGLAGRMRTLLHWIFQGPNWGKRLMMVVLPVLLSAAAGTLVYWASHDQSGTVKAILTALGAAAALLVQAATWLRPWLHKVSDAWSQLEKVKEEIDRAAEERRVEIRKEEEALQQDLTRLRANEARLQSQIAEDRERIRKLEEEIRKAQGPRDVSEFVQAQAISQEYQGRLGFIAKVRRDFDRLNQLMVPDGKEERPIDLPRIDRIVLYVDDLDRCPGDRVVQVLEAVHLLLAMPLFVVIVGVDPRWLLRSLEEHYSEFLASRDSHAGLLEEDEVSDWASTPLHYLEKIFQIPFTLQPMGQDGFTRLVRSMVQTQPPRLQAAAVSTPSEERASAELSPAAAAPGVTPNASESSAISPESAPKPIAPPVALPRLDPSPPFLEIDPLEVGFMSELAPLIHSPRSAKRLVNIYRLIRAQLDRRQLYDFVGSADAPGEHQAVLVLLAILVGFPDQASWLLRSLRDRERWGSWWELVDGLTPEAGQDGRYVNACREDITEAEHRTWLKLQAGLQGLRKRTKLPDKLDFYRKWVIPVARFSFKSGRLVSGAGG